jgi:hypothetical protein
VKKILNLGTTCEEKLENNWHSQEEEEEGIGTSSKGQSDGFHPNDQIVDNLLNKKKREKTPIAKRVFISKKQGLQT